MHGFVFGCGSFNIPSAKLLNHREKLVFRWPSFTVADGGCGCLCFGYVDGILADFLLGRENNREVRERGEQNVEGNGTST